MAALSCSIPMNDFITSLSYQAGQFIRARVKARNNAGWSDISNPNTDSVLAQTKPISAPSGISANTTTTSITLFWNSLSLNSDIGFRVLSHYNIYSNGGSGSTFNLLMTTTLASGTVITPLTTGSTHIFRISAENLYGEGPLSS